MTAASWKPSYTLGERLKYTLIPPKLNMWRLIRKNLRKGEPELRFLPHLVPRDRIAIDAGANKGVYTHMLSRLVPKVEAFEPNPKLFWILNRALPKNAAAHPVALSDREGEAELYIPGRAGRYSNQRASLSLRRAMEGGGSVKVATRTLDSYDFRNVGFIKMDVEGFEETVLKGAAGTLARERPTILIEMEEQHTGQPIETSIANLAAFGYAVFFLRDNVLRPVAELDPDLDHRRAVNTKRYIFNFIAKPL